VLYSYVFFSFIKVLVYIKPFAYVTMHVNYFSAHMSTQVYINKSYKMSYYIFFNLTNIFLFFDPKILLNKTSLIIGIFIFNLTI